MLEAAITRQLREFALDVAIRVNNGKILVLMGENGAGKSTILNALAGFVEPDAGTIRIGGDTVFDRGTGVCMPVEERRIGYVFQKPTVFPHMTVYDNIAFGPRARHCDATTVKERVDQWLECLDIQRLAGVRAAQLSGGQKQRVALARALATEPSLLMLDEPFVGLDAENITSVKEAVRQYTTDLAIPCILVTHRVADAHELGDRACLICRGTCTWEGKPSDMPDCGFGFRF